MQNCGNISQMQSDRIDQMTSTHSSPGRTVHQVPCNSVLCSGQNCQNLHCYPSPTYRTNSPVDPMFQANVRCLSSPLSAGHTCCLAQPIPSIWSHIPNDNKIKSCHCQAQSLYSSSNHSLFSFASKLCQIYSLISQRRFPSCNPRRWRPNTIILYIATFVFLVSSYGSRIAQATSSNDAWRHSAPLSLPAHASPSIPSRQPSNVIHKKLKSTHHIQYPSATLSSSYGTPGQRMSAQANHPSSSVTNYSPYLNSQLLSIPFSSHHHQLLYQHQMLPHLSSSSSSTSISTLPVQLSNQISRSSNTNNIRMDFNHIPPSGESNMIRMKGSKWWDIARHPSDSMLLEQTQHMDGRHTNAIIPTNSLTNNINLPLRKKQRRLVRDNPGVLMAISKAMRLAIGECQNQFKDRRWNCPVNDWKKGKNMFGRIIQRGCRETAFVYALTSAAVAHSIARACSEGMIETCTCDYRHNRKPSGIDWEWGGCSDNIEFGYKFAKAFVDAAERGRDLRFVMNLHNNEAGRLHVSHEMRRECKCHGMSGSCTVKTCWMRLPSFRDIGNNLKDRFDGASRVLVSNDYRGITRKMYKKVQLKPYETGYKTPTRKDLIYFEESPDFCSPNPKYGVSGTAGRICNASSIGVEGCHLLCCGRGYVTEEIEEFERCNCTFHWCCQVHCKICKTKKKIHRCL